MTVFTSALVLDHLDLRNTVGGARLFMLYGSHRFVLQDVSYVAQIK
jgi:hypothetical protein